MGKQRRSRVKISFTFAPSRQGRGLELNGASGAVAAHFSPGSDEPAVAQAPAICQALPSAPGDKTRSKTGEAFPCGKAGFHGETREMESQAKSEGRVASRGRAASPEEGTHRGRARGRPRRRGSGSGRAPRRHCSRSRRRGRVLAEGGPCVHWGAPRTRAGWGLHGDPQEAAWSQRGQLSTRGPSRLCSQAEPTGGEGTSDP